MMLKYSQWLRLPKFSVFAVENMRCGDLCYPALPSPNINKSNMGLISLTGHTGPRFEMLQLQRSWLFTNHFRLNSTLRSAAEAVMARYKKRSRCVIGVHVRRTDYKKLLGKNIKTELELEETRTHFHTVASRETELVMSFLRSHFLIKSCIRLRCLSSTLEL